MKIYVKASDDDFYDPYRGNKYIVYADDNRGNMQNKATNSPQEAIEYWFKFNSKPNFRSQAYVMAKSKSDAVVLVSAGTPEFLTDMWDKYSSPYKLEYLIDVCERSTASGCRFFYEGEFGDTVDPFSAG